MTLTTLLTTDLIDGYEIRCARVDETADLQHFIAEDWRAGHILSTSKTLLHWQHLTSNNHYLNFLVAKNQRTGKFDSILGLIPTFHYDCSLISQQDWWLAIWMTVKDRAERTALGLALFNKLLAISPNSVGAIGINANVARLYKAMGFTLGETTQYLIPNLNRKSFSIAHFEYSSLAETAQKYALIEVQQSNIRLAPTSLDVLSSLDGSYSPKKNIAYFRSRYFNHPVYKYSFWGVFKNDIPVGCFVIRIQSCLGSQCVRIVDFLGSLSNIPSLFSEFQRFLISIDAEYADLIYFGPEGHELNRIGFTQRFTNDIVPNYFEPFEQRNVDIAIAFKSNSPDYVVFKGDSDQDRPSFI